MDRVKVLEKVRMVADKYGYGNPQQLKQLKFLLGKESDREVFFGLFAFFYDASLQENEFNRQKLAGILLFSVNPEPPLDLDGSIYASAQFWNLSVEELPWYFCKHFESTKVINFLTEHIAESDMKLKKKLETMLFWSRIYENENT